MIKKITIVVIIMFLVMSIFTSTKVFSKETNMKNNTKTEEQLDELGNINKKINYF